MIENVTVTLKDALATCEDIRHALNLISGCSLFGRETRSAALGEISEYLVVQIVGGKRLPNGNKGFDIEDAAGANVEVKSRLTGKWRDGLMFDFRRHTHGASRVFCIAWTDETGVPAIAEAYTMPIDYLGSNWGCVQSPRYFARTTLGKLRAAYSATIPTVA